MTSSTPDPSLAVQVALMEFQKLRDEIASRSGIQWALVGLTITGSGLVAGFSISNTDADLLLLLLPILAPALGLLFVDHALTILRIGEHIDSQIAPLVRGLAGQGSLMKHEEQVYKSKRQVLWDIIPFGLAVLLLFNVIPIIALYVTFPSLNAQWTYLSWYAGMALTILELFFMIRYLVTLNRR
jgi:hypothetical protein